MKNKIIIILLAIFIFPFSKIKAVDITYQAHVQDYGWLTEVKNGEIGGTEGKSKRVEAFKIYIKNTDYNGDITYQTHVQDYGWLNWVKNGEMGGTEGQSKRVEALKINLTGELKDKYDLYYRAHVQDYGWLNWVKNGEIGGTEGKSKRVEAVQIKLVEKETNDVNLSYSSKNIDGWLDYVNNGQVSGTEGQSKPIKGLKIKLNNSIQYDGGINYQVYTDRWLSEVSNDSIAGVDDKNIQAVKIKLTGELSNKYNIFYRTHVSNIGWMDYTSNGEPAGTIGLSNNIEALEIVLQDKDNSTIEVGKNSFREINASINYSSHVSDIGWMKYVSDGEISGTTGRSLQIEAFKIKINSNVEGKILYKTYITKRGWTNYFENDTVSGTEGLSRSIEAINIKLSGEISNYYDVYYRTHVSDIGWLSWTKNGSHSGCLDSNVRIEAMQIKLVRKGVSFTEDTSKPFVTGSWKNNNTNYYDYFGRKSTGFKLINGIKYYFDGDGVLLVKNAKKVIDVSSWQSDIDWDLIKKDEDVDEAIIRVGWGTSYGDECGLDSKFDRNIKAVQRLGIPYGVYIYAYAENNDAAKKEAEFVISKLNQYNAPKLTYVWYDAEIYSISRNTYNSVIPAFINEIKSAGYNNVGVYGGVRQLDTSSGNLNTSTIRNYPIWVSQYYKKLQYSGEFRGWQYASDEHVNGINGNVDASVFK